MERDGQSVIGILCDKVISGELLAEIPTAERLGISRTPVRRLHYAHMQHHAV